MVQQSKNLFIRRVIGATRNSIAGFRSAWQTEEAFRVEVVLFLGLVPFAFVLGKTLVETVLLLFSLLIVLIVELLNTSVEKTVDRISSEHHALSGTIKDLASAAVFVSILSALLVWGAIGVARFLD
jgi:diacylglycerol kinase (ATP)